MADEFRLGKGTPKPAVEDTEFGCVSCEAIETFSKLAGEYVDAMGEALAEPTQTLFLSLVGLWAAVTAIKVIMGDSPLGSVPKEVFFIILSFGLMQSQGTELIANIYNVTLRLMGDIATVAFTLHPNVPAVEGEGFAGLMEAGERGVRGVINFGLARFESGALTDPMTYITPLLLIVPYCMVVVVFFSKVVVGIFRLMMVGTFSPFLIMCFAFAWGRAMAIAGMKTVLSSIAILFAASAAFGLLLYGVNDVMPDNVNGLVDWTSEDITKDKLLVIIALGWMGVALMTEGVGLANSITGTALSNTAAGILTAGIAGSAAMMARYGRGAATAGSAYSRMRQGTSDNIGGFMQMGRDAKAVMSRAAGVARPFVPRSGNP